MPHHVGNIPHLKVRFVVAVLIQDPNMASRGLDPILAMSVGIAAAAVRINREEKEKGRSTQETIDSLGRRTSMLFDGDKNAQKTKQGQTV